MRVLRSRKPGTRAAGPGGKRPAAASPRKPEGRRKPGKRGASRRAGRGGRIGKVLYWSSVLAIWGVLLFSAVVIWFAATLPDPLVAGLEKRPPNVTILSTDGAVLSEQGLRRTHIRLEKLPDYLVDAVVATEDRRFYSHFGIDPLGLARAAWRNANAGAVVEGGSTITQQLAKNLFLSSDRTYARKAQEVVLAVWLETRFTKKEILELYLNRVYFGAGAWGVEAAARRYFGKPSSDVNLAEAALLAGLLKAPSRYSPTQSPRRAEERAAVVLTRMVDTGKIGGPEAMAALAEPARAKNPDGVTGFEYAVDWVMEQLPEFIGEREQDVVVETTIDARLQRAAQDALQETLEAQGAKYKAGQGAVVLLDAAGSVRAMAGGRSYTQSQFNRAVKSLRQPGSAFKPFVYLAALEAGLTPDTVVRDEPVSINGWRPKNYHEDYKGEMSMRDALAQSVNTVAVRLMMEVGRARVVRTARRLGIESPIHQNPSIALGTAEVTLLELTGSYSAFANGGAGVMPHVIRRVKTATGKTLYTRKGSGPGRVIAPQYVGAMNDMMNAALVEGTGRRAAIPGHPAGGKTGTSQESRDAWFVGYTAHFVAGVWVGNDDGAPMAKVTGGSLPAEIWRRLMTEAHAGVQPAQLPGTWSPSIAHQGPAQPRQAPEPAGDGLLRRMMGVLGPRG
ncbi:MAG: PBP1A family penicillin-binding protein [Pseudomonadota bacterium]|nr:PBP1A family penicillin-binding protein [Pseudomonadota bacterium]